MYLMSITNLDYVWITIYFALIAIVAYLFRRKNATSNDFLFSVSKVDEYLLYFGTFGVIEIVLGGVAGSQVGISAMYMVALVIFIATFLCRRVCCHYYISDGVTNFNDYIHNQLGKTTGVVVAILNILLLLGLIVITICLTFKLLQSLLGWNFVNSVVGVMGLTIIYMIIGGILGMKYNKIIQMGTVILVFVLVAVLALFHLGGFGGLSDNLTNLAKNQGKVADFYTTLQFNSAKMADFILVLIGLGGFYLLNFTLTKENDDEVCGGSAFGVIAKFMLLIILILPGLLAIGTKVVGNNINGKEIVTIQAQLPDGQTGYIVKAVDSANPDLNMVPGILPPMINPVTSIAEKNSYNYDLASVVVFRHYLPVPLQFLIVLALFAAFMLSISSYISNSCCILLRNVLLPYSLIARYGDVGEIWAIRISILLFGVLTLTVAYFLAPYFALTKDVCFLVAALIAPLLASLVLALLINRVGRAYIPVLCGVAVAIIMSFAMNNPNLLHKYSIIAIVSFILTLLAGLFVNRADK